MERKRPTAIPCLRARRVDWSVCEECNTVANADVNGAENIREKILPNLVTDGGNETRSVSSAHQNASRSEDGNRDNGWLAQPAVHLFDRSEGSFAPREQVVNREP
jgi:putative transposase